MASPALLDCRWGCVRRTCRFCWEPLAECVCPDEDPATEALKQATGGDGSDEEEGEENEANSAAVS